MTRRRGRIVAVALAVAICGGLVAVGRARSGADDILAAEVARWVAYVEGHAPGGDMWTQLEQAASPLLAGARAALHDNRPFLALQRLAPARQNLAADKYLLELSARQRPTSAVFEAEWSRIGQELKSDLEPPRPSVLEGVAPAAVRAMGEEALPQVRGFYEASLEYGRNTMPESGLFYIGSALAARDFVRFCRTLPAPAPRPMPPLRSISSEIEALQADILKTYRPPAALDRHSDFIAVNSALNEARDLDAAGLRYGALLRYLRAALRFFPLRQMPAMPADVPAALAQFEARIAAAGPDHSIARLFLEEAHADTALAPPIAADVLPRYFAALEPRAFEPPHPAPRVTVTLVRWPYT